MLRNLLSRLGEQTSVAIVLRKIVELNFRQEKRAIRESLTLRHGESILDLGCGTGEFAPLFRAEDYRGLDIEPSNIAYAKRHYPGYQFQTGDAMKLPFPDASFAAILVVGVLHHLSLEECRRTLSEMRRVLKPGGKVLVMEDTKTDRLVSRIMHSLDQGAYIRTQAEWEGLLSGFFSIRHSWTFKSGVCFYSGFFLAHRTGV